ncbi:MAG: hypothetical protein WBC51_24650 [Vicinamibacterales bacterium]
MVVVAVNAVVGVAPRAEVGVATEVAGVSAAAAEAAAARQAHPPRAAADRIALPAIHPTHRLDLPVRAARQSDGPAAIVLFRAAARAERNLAEPAE